jgi:hypothetical protein
MMPGTGLPASTRVIDVGAPDDTLARALADAGIERYLGLTAARSLAAVRAEAGERAVRYQPLDDVSVVGRCSADLLVLRSGFQRLVWAPDDLADFRWVAVERERAVAGAEVRAAVRFGLARGRLRRAGRWQHGQVELDVFEVGEPGPRTPRARTYFTPGWGVEGLAARLADAGVAYAVLRWFDALPAMEPGEDLDVLVADEDVDAFRALLESEPGTVPVDLYSVSGLAGSDYQGAAYYAPDLARALLARTETHRSGMRVPAPADHLRSLAYHALYHKGTRSGLVSRLVADVVPDPEHDYRVALDKVAASCGVQLPPDMEGIDDYLASVGWRPPLDALRRLSVQNSWLRLRLGQDVAEAGGPQLAVFLVRERALDVLTTDDVVAELRHRGFEPLVVRPLDAAARTRGAQQLRGGNWAAGPFPVSGGGPALLVAALHYAPDPVSPDLRQRYPHLANESIYYAKQAVRDALEARLGPDAMFNAIHSADDETEAWEYLDVVAPDAVDEIQGRLRRRIARQSAGPDVVRTLSRGRRARVDVVEGPGGKAVRKTFAPVGRGHLEREVAALRGLAGRVAAVPELLDTGENWFTIPWYDDSLRLRPGRLLPMRTLRRMVGVLEEIHAAGWDLVDAKPANFVHDASVGLMAVDFEFAYERPPGDTTSFADSPAFRNPNRELYPDLPVGDSTYGVRWLPVTGMPRPVLLEGSPVQQHLARLRYRLRTATTRPGSPLRRTARWARATARTAFLGTTRRRAWSVTT